MGGISSLVVSNTGGTWENFGDIYDNSSSDLSATNMQSAVDELKTLVDTVSGNIVAEDLWDLVGDEVQPKNDRTVTLTNAGTGLVVENDMVVKGDIYGGSPVKIKGGLEVDGDVTFQNSTEKATFDNGINLNESALEIYAAEGTNRTIRFQDDNAGFDWYLGVDSEEQEGNAAFFISNGTGADGAQFQLNQSGNVGYVGINWPGNNSNALGVYGNNVFMAASSSSEMALDLDFGSNLMTFGGKASENWPRMEVHEDQIIFENESADFGVRDANIYFNTSYNDYDFMVRGNTASVDLLKCDAGDMRVGVNTDSPVQTLHVRGTGDPTISPPARGYITVQSTTSTGSNCSLCLVSGNQGKTMIDFGDTDDETIGNIRYSHDENIMELAQSNVYRVTVGNQFYPSSDDSISCGKSGNRWTSVWATDGSINTSDINDKENIVTLDSNLGLDFINELNPVSFKWKNKTVYEYTGTEDASGNSLPDIETPVDKTYTRKHTGLIAQEVATALSTLNVETSGFAGYIDPSVNDPESTDSTGLRYTEFIAPIIKAIQELTARVEALET